MRDGIKCHQEKKGKGDLSLEMRGGVTDLEIETDDPAGHHLEIGGATHLLMKIAEENGKTRRLISALLAREEVQKGKGTKVKISENAQIHHAQEKQFLAAHPLVPERSKTGVLRKTSVKSSRIEEEGIKILMLAMKMKESQIKAHGDLGKEVTPQVKIRMKIVLSMRHLGCHLSDGV